MLRLLCQGSEKKYEIRSKNQNWVQRERDRSKRQSKQLKAEVLNAYGNRCSCANCTETRHEFMTVDHIVPVGSLPIEMRNKKARSGKSFYAWLKRNNYPSGFRLLCMNCNFAVGHYGYCPHANDIQ